MKNTKIKMRTGMDFPKKRILEIINLFDLHVDYDQWKEKGWIRIGQKKEPNLDKNLILFKDYLEVQANREEKFLSEFFSNYLIEIGEEKMRKSFRELLNI